MAIKSRLSINRNKKQPNYTTRSEVRGPRGSRGEETRFSAPIPWSGVSWARVVPGQQPDNREGNGFDLIILNKLAGKGLPPNVVIIRIFRRNSIGVTPWAFATSSVYAD